MVIQMQEQLSPGWEVVELPFEEMMLCQRHFREDASKELYLSRFVFLHGCESVYFHLHKLVLMISKAS
jgi:hypothetical protein